MADETAAVAVERPDASSRAERRRRRKEGPHLRNIEVVPSDTGAAEDLVVFVHGAFGSPSTLDDVVEQVRKHRPDAAFMRPWYGGTAALDDDAPWESLGWWRRFRRRVASLFARDDPLDLASELETAIHEADLEHGFKKITLIGHSAGALLARKAYVYGCGSTEDRGPWLARSPARPWSEKVDRIVLFAGMNRGWSIAARSEKTSLPYYLTLRAFNAVFRALGVGTWLTRRGRLARSVERGAPFVADLRVQWIQLPKSRRPLVVQMLGDGDPFVSNADQADLLVHGDFVFIPVLGSQHHDVTRFDASAEGRRRKDLFDAALSETKAVLVRKYRPPPTQADGVEKPAEVVFLVHGIRDWGHWTQRARRAIREAAMDRYGGNGDRVKIVTPRYRYLPMLMFLFMSERQKNVRWFMDEYTEELARDWPREGEARPPKLHFLGHSNGTYLLASALSRYATVHFDRVALAGSVVPRSYPWDDLVAAGRVRKVRNDLGSRDWVVGLFPRLFELLHVADIGSGGFNGFTDNAGNEAEVIHKGGHGVAVKTRPKAPPGEGAEAKVEPALAADDNRRSIAEFLLADDFIPPDTGIQQSRFWGVLSKLCPVVWAVGIAAIIVGAVAVASLAGTAAAALCVAAVVALLLLV